MTEATNGERTERISRRGLKALRVFVRNRLALLGTVMLLGFVFCASFPNVVAPHDPYDMDLANPFAPPGSPGHLLGTDNFGRDILSRLIYGSRISLTVGLVVVGIAATIGTTLGLLSGYYGGVVDILVMRLVEVFYSFPFLILAIAVMAVLGPSIYNVMLVLGLVNWPIYARLVRSRVLSLREEPFVEACRALGAGNARIMFRHLLPNCLSPVIVTAAMGMAGAILSTAALGFLGLGVQPPTPEWGTMLNEGKDFLRRTPHMITYPGVAIMLVVLSLNFIGDGLRDALDPRLTHQR
ncbi:ABC transporter permease [Candidatus Bipolaricaulota bacterium]|nr:ABC transporter permease [Candidatus Bipolaricaulota bacterium]